jgi:hypothetical protein
VLGAGETALFGQHSRVLVENGLLRPSVARLRCATTAKAVKHFEYDFVYATAMEHVYQVLEGLTVYLIESHGQNEEWQEILNSY